MSDARDLRVCLVGNGRLAASLTAALQRAGYRVLGIAGRQTPNLDSMLAEADLVFLTVQDANIRELAAALPWRPGQFAVHCSGALTLNALDPAARAGAIVGCLHPLQSFPSRAPEPDRFHGITCGIEAPEPLAGVFDQIARDLGSRTLRLEGADRRLYHAAAVFASNDVIALMSAARRAWKLAGLPEDLARSSLAPLLVAAAANVQRLELADALTGPVARGDVPTIEAHLSALAADPSLERLYRGLAAELLRVVEPSHPEAASKLAHILDGDS